MPNILSQNQTLVFLAFLWVLPWKGWSLWKAAKLNEKYWFIILLIVNTFGLLEILYIFIFSKKEFREKFSKLLKMRSKS